MLFLFLGYYNKESKDIEIILMLNIKKWNTLDSFLLPHLCQQVDIPLHMERGLGRGTCCLLLQRAFASLASLSADKGDVESSETVEVIILHYFKE